MLAVLMAPPLSAGCGSSDDRNRTRIVYSGPQPGNSEGTEDNDNGKTLSGITGANKGQATEIMDYEGATKGLTFTAMTAAFADDDEFIVV